MKKMILSAALVLASTAAMAQKSNFQVKVDLKNFATDSVIVFKGRDVKMDTILVKMVSLPILIILPSVKPCFPDTEDLSWFGTKDVQLPLRARREG